MKSDQLIQALESAAEQLAVRVRYETLVTGVATASGGLCKVKGEWWVLIDKKASPSERVAVLVDALSTFDLEKLQLPPKVREVLEARRAIANAPVSPPAP